MIGDQVKLDVNYLTRHVAPADSPCGVPEYNQIKIFIGDKSLPLGAVPKLRHSFWDRHRPPLPLFEILRQL